MPSPRLRRMLATAALIAVSAAAAAGLMLTPLTRRAGAAEDRCAVPVDFLRLGEAAPPVVAEHQRDHRLLTVVALGSSSTSGTGASSPRHSYPSQLEADLSTHLAAGVQVLNRGVAGETAAAMVARLGRDVLPYHPDLVIWQVGTNGALHDLDPAAEGELMRQGVARLKSAGSEVVLMDLQYAPAVIAHPRYRDMLHVIAATARSEEVGVFHRFSVMRYWADEGRFTMAGMLAPDHLHMNDASYACLARLLARSLLGIGSEDS